MNQKKFLSLCELSIDNYLQLEDSFFEFAEIVYVYDDWNRKKKIFTMQLAHMLSSICISIEESMKLFLVNSENNLLDEFLQHIDSYPDSEISKKSKKDIKKELKKEDLDNVKIQWILDFKDFRKILNKFTKAVIYPRKTSHIYFRRNFDSKGKPGWFSEYEDIKHNFYSQYPKATISTVFNALSSYYLIARVLAHEATFFVKKEYKGGYFPWYEGEIYIDRSMMVGAPKNYIAKFESSHFEALGINKKAKKPNKKK